MNCPTRIYIMFFQYASNRWFCYFVFYLRWILCFLFVSVFLYVHFFCCLYRCVLFNVLNLCLVSNCGCVFSHRRTSHTNTCGIVQVSTFLYVNGLLIYILCFWLIVLPRCFANVCVGPVLVLGAATCCHRAGFDVNAERLNTKQWKHLQTKTCIFNVHIFRFERHLTWIVSLLICVQCGFYEHLWCFEHRFVSQLRKEHCWLITFKGIHTNHETCFMSHACSHTHTCFHMRV